MSQFALFILAVAVGGKTLVVDPARAHQENTFSRIQQAVDQLTPGDQCVIRPGLYRETVRLRHSGTSSNPIVIRALPDVQLSGLEQLHVQWTRRSDGIMEAVVPAPVRQLFVNGVLMTPARWPNMPPRDRWAESTFRKSAEGSRLGLMVDPALAKSRHDWTGSMAVLNVGSFQTFRRRVQEHHRGGDRFVYAVDPNEKLGGAGRHPIGMDRYCLFGFPALDQPGEWFYDAPGRRLLMIPPVGVELTDATIETRQRDRVFVLQEVQNVELTGLNIVAGVVQFQNCRNCKLTNTHFTYASCIANPFGDNVANDSLTSKQWNTRRWFRETSLTPLVEITGKDNVVRDCSVRYSEGPAMTLGGEGHRLENCLFHDNDWHGLDYGYGLDCLAAKDMTIRRLTMFNAGGSEGVRLANHGKSLVELCHLHHLGLRQSDGSCVQLSGDSIRGSEIRFNWIHDHNAFHWGGTGLRADDGSRGVHFHHNVVWNCRHKGIVTKGDEHQVHHNTCFDNAEHDILVPRDPLPGKPKELREQNHHSVVEHNLSRIAGNWIWQKPAPPYARLTNNRAVQSSQLQDVANWDFRLADAYGRGAGAYGNLTSHWKAGCINAITARRGMLVFRLPTFAADSLHVTSGSRQQTLQIKPGQQTIPVELTAPYPWTISSAHLGEAKITREGEIARFHRPMLPTEQ